MGFIHLIIIAIAMFLPGQMDPSNNGQVGLVWTASISQNIAGYKAYYGYVSGNYTAAGSPQIVPNQLSYTVTGLAQDKCRMVYFAVTAFNTIGSESGYSNEVQKFVSNGQTTCPAMPPTISLEVH